MTEEKKETGTPAPGGDGQEPAPDQKQGAVDLDRAARKYRKQAERADARVAELQAKLDEIAQASKSEQEKAIEEAARKARAEAESEWQGKFTRERVSSGLRAKLSDLGLPSKLATAIEAEADISSPDDVDEAVDGWLKANEWATAYKQKNTPPGQGGSPGGKPSPKEIDLRTASRDELKANWPDVRDSILKKMQGG